jgi:hypothetical protein
LADLRIDPVTQDLLRRKIAGLRDWLAGDEHWILTSGRYFAPTPGETELLARAAAVAPIPEPELSSATPAGPGSPEARPATARRGPGSAGGRAGSVRRPHDVRASGRRGRRRPREPARPGCRRRRRVSRSEDLEGSRNETRGSVLVGAWQRS